MSELLLISASEEFVVKVQKLAGSHAGSVKIAKNGQKGLDLISELRPENLQCIIIDEGAMQDLTVNEFHDICIMRFNINTPPIHVCYMKKGELFSKKTDQAYTLEQLN